MTSFFYDIIILVKSMKSKKVVFVDLLRVLACIIIIVCHCKLYLPGDTTTKSKVLLSCLTADGVSIFWMIMGMFYFRDISYKDRLKKLFKRIIIPIIIMSVIIFYFYDYLLGIKTFINSINHPLIDYISLIKNHLIIWEPINFLGHLWYLYVYVLIVVLYPLLNKLREYIDTLDYKKVLIFFIIVLVLNDLTLNRLLVFSHHAFQGVFSSLIFFFTGYLLYKNNNDIKDKGIIKYILIYIIINLIRAVFAYLVLKNDPNNRELLKWYTSFGLVVGISLYMFIKNLSDRIKFNDISTKIISHLSKLTLYTYLVHPNIILIIETRGYSVLLMNKINNIYIYFIIYILIVSIISIIISELILLISYLFKKMSK